MKAKAILSTVAVGLGISLTSALAIPVNITLSGSPPFSGSSAVVANNVSPSNFGDDTVFNWLTADVSAWNTINGTGYAAPTRNADGTALLKVTTSSGPDSITLALGSYDYVFLHWGGQRGGWSQAYYIGNDTSGSHQFSAPPGGHPAVGGLSFYSFYGSTRTPVPDGGATLALLGLALGCLGFVRRRFAV